MSSGGAILDRQNQIHILEKHEYEKGLRNIFNLLTVRGEYQVIGSGAIEEVAYGSDYDLQEFIKEPDYIRSTAHLLELFRKKFKDAEKDPDVFILDFKCGVDDAGEPIRWDKKSIAKGSKIVDKRKVTFQECLLMKSTIKMDITALVDGIFIEFSDNYYITLKDFNTFTAVAKSHQDILYSLQHESRTKYHHGDYWKASKRIFAYLKSIGKTKNLIKKLITYFNSETGYLSKNRSELDIIALVVDNKFRKPKKEDVVRNLKIVKDDVEKVKKLHVKEDFGFLIDKVCAMPLSKMKPEIEKLSDYLKSVVNADTKQFLDRSPDITHYILNEVAGGKLTREMIEAKSRDRPTNAIHIHPDGIVMTGSKHTSASKVIQTGGSRNSGYIQKLIAEKSDFSISKMKTKPSEWLLEKYPKAKKDLKAELAKKLATASFVPDKKLEEEIKSKEFDLDALRKQYDASYIAKAMKENLTGKRAKYSVGDKPADYFRRYNNLKEELEDLTGRKYPVLESFADIDKRAKKLAKEEAKQDAKKAEEEKKNPKPVTDMFPDGVPKKKKKSQFV